ncbi:MAG: J domain-containing protein [Spirochaetota bacterium]
MKNYHKITEARKLLGLPERATMKQIKSNYRALLAKWHPDRCSENKGQCKEMTQKIIAAYKTIIDYCHQYKYSFSKKEIQDQFSENEWWFERFGNDPIWSN